MGVSTLPESKARKGQVDEMFNWPYSATLWYPNLLNREGIISKKNKIKNRAPFQLNSSELLVRL